MSVVMKYKKYKKINGVNIPMCLNLLSQIIV